MNVLLMENSPGCGLQMKTELEKHGHTVTWIVGVAQLAEHQIVGLLPSPDPVNQLFGEEQDADLSRTIEIDLNEIDFAFCDARLLGPIKDGLRIVPALVANGIVCCASSVAGNPPLMQAGTQVGINKLFVLRAMRGGVLDIEKVVVDPKRGQRELEAFETRDCAEMLKAHREHRRFVTGFQCLDSLN